ncbi:peroxisome biogenesis factor 1 [Fopius arisanus]|uniref:Peroxisomal ATPase PEX1 n=1 Tax=Fopius arisanus TaxID=64838 RepID=A0A9R1TWJ8_9HYME|nr:PREDICTED: peroxisome biogenesis factor 1 [Fopius arisanus]
MQNEKFSVKYVPVKNCFVILPSAWYHRLSSQIAQGVIKLSYEEKDFYLSASQSQSSPTDFLCISATFGKYLNIKEGAEVNVSYIPDPPALTTITVRPFNSEDWQIVNLQVEKIQSTLLHQINIASPNQPIVIWLSKYLNVALLIESISPPFLYGKLENYTEVHVQDATEDKTPGDAIPKEITTHSRYRENESDCEVFLKSWRHQDLPKIFRVCLVSVEKKYRINEGVLETQITSPHNIFVCSNQLREFFPDRDNFSMVYGRIEKIFQDKQSTNLIFTPNDQRINRDPEIIVSLSRVEELFNKQFIGTNVDEKNIWISEDLARDSNLRLGSKIHIKPLNITDNTITSLQLLCPPNFDRETGENQFKNYVRVNSIKNDLVISQNMRVSLEKGKCRVKLHPEDVPHVLLNEETLKAIKIEIIEEGNLEEAQEIPQVNDFRSEDVYVSPLTKILEDSVQVLQMGLSPQRYPFPLENILICGDIGTGKTTFLNFLQHKLRSPPNFMHTIIVDCKKLKGKKVDAVSKFFTSTIHDCVYYQPSVLFLDNLESITSFPSDEENSPDATNATRISEYLNSLLTIYQSSHLISVVASTTRVDKLGVGLRPARGVHVFQTILNIPLLSREERAEFLEFNLQRKVEISSEINFEFYSGKTEGWVFQDLSELCEKSVFLTWKRRRRSPVLEDEDLSRALDVIKPLSLYGVSLFTGDGNNWGDIGGLEEVKESLRQLLQWPLMYPGLFQKAPVKHQNGILLYGMPGTGKTMLAGAIAKECGLKFINIKGPELLSKYIGASEEAVRSVFEKAQRIRPCIIFFDEFESLAPRRGHDSTGVTDRVVNQLLTQFDGVEGREGVAIVAASSRPDLLDPALLRPGRLDKSLLCPLPDEQTRATILDTLCKRHAIDVKDLDLLTLARMTSGFTGADLMAILTQARLDAVEEHLKKSTELQGVRITQDMLIRSIQDTQPSLTLEEINKFTRIYNRFLTGDNAPEDLEKIQKATLA